MAVATPCTYEGEAADDAQTLDCYALLVTRMSGERSYDSAQPCNLVQQPREARRSVTTLGGCRSRCSDKLEGVTLGVKRTL